MVQGSSFAVASGEPPRTKTRTVLIVDDSPEDRVAHRRYLERSDDAHYEILEEEMGERGLQVCLERRPDCVLLDFGLPDMQGLEFLQRLNEIGEGPICPVVILTGAMNEGMAVEALKSGAHDYLVKGRVTREGIRIAIDSAIEKASLQREVRATQARLRTALESMLDCFAILGAIRDSSGQIVDFAFEYANEKVCEEANLTKKQIAGRPLSAVLANHRRPELYGEYLRVMETGELVSREVVIEDPDDPSEFPEVLHAWDVRISRVDNGIAVAWRDITEQKAAESYVYRMNQILERRVEERTAELRAAIEELEGFTYTVAHDLRAPLRAIIATSKIVLEEAAEKLGEEHRGLLRRQAANAQRLGVLIDDLLRLCRISRQDMHKSRVDLSALARDICAAVEFAPDTVPPAFDIQDQLVAFGDPILLRLALLNLIENAVKFSTLGGTVSVGGYSDGDKNVFFVRDNGIGFDMQFAHKLFVPFERLHRESEFPGTGIGLANVQRVIHRHGGTVWAESVPGRGATFYFALPGE